MKTDGRGLASDLGAGPMRCTRPRYCRRTTEAAVRAIGDSEMQHPALAESAFLYRGIYVIPR